MATTSDKLQLIIETQDKFHKNLNKYQKDVDAIAKKSSVASTKTTKLNSGMTKLGKALPTVAVGALAAGILNYTKSTNEAIDKTYNLSKQTGATVKTLSSLNYVFELNKASSEDVAGTFNYMSRTIGALEAGSASTIDKFDKFGVSIKDVDGNMRSMEDIFYDSIDSLNAIQNETERSAKATQLFGKSAGNLASVIDTGSKALREQAKEADRLGISYDINAAKKAEKFNDSLLKLQSTFGGLARDLTTRLTPALVSVIESTQEAVEIWSYWGDSIGDFWDKIHSNGKEKILGLALTKEQMESVAPALLKGLGKVSFEVRNLDRDWEKLGGNTAENVKKWNKLKASRDALITQLDKEGISSDRAYQASSRYVGQQDKEIASAKKLADLKKKNASTTNTDTEVVEKKPKEVDYRDIKAARQDHEDQVLDIIYNAKSKEYDAELEYQAKKKELQNESFLLSLDGQSLELETLKQDYEEKLKLYKQYNVDSANLTATYSAEEYEVRSNYSNKETETKIRNANAYANTALTLSQSMANSDRKYAKLAQNISKAKVSFSGAVGIGKAMEKGWAGIPEALMIGAETAAQLITINSQSYATGANRGVIQGSSYTGDKVPVMANSGEVIMNKNQQQNLLNMATTGTGGGGGGNTYVINVRDNVGTNDRKIAQLVRNGVDKLKQTNQPNRML